MNKIYIVIIFLFFLATNANSSENVYEFTGFSGRIDEDNLDTKTVFIYDSITIDFERQSIRSNDLSYSFEICKDAYICYTSQWFNFALPENWNESVTTSWRVRGFQYLYSGKLDTEIFGVYQDINVIEVKNETALDLTSNPMLVFYSKSHGVIGFTIMWYRTKESRFEPMTYWLKGQQGFGELK